MSKFVSDIHKLIFIPPINFYTILFWTFRWVITYSKCVRYL